MDWLRALLESSPLTALFLTIAVGYLVGEVNLKGFALGSGAVLFVGLACGAFAPKSAPPGMLGHLGPAALPLLRGHPVRRRMVPRSHQHRGAEGQLRRAVRLDRGGRRLAADLQGRRGQPAPGARDVCRLRHEHSDAPGDPRRASEPGRRGRLQRDLPVWRRRPDPLHVRLPRVLQAED